MIPVAVVTVVAVLIAGWAIDQNRRTTAFNQAHAAYLRGDCPAALARYARADRGSVPWGSTVEPDFADGPERAECGQLQDLAANWEAGNLTETAAAYEKFRTDHSASPALIGLYQLVAKSGQAPALLDSIPDRSACNTLRSLGRTRSALESDFDSSAGSVRYAYPKGTPDAAVDPANLVSCGAAFEKAGSTETAWELYSLALIYADGKLKDQATSGTARTNVQLMKDAHAGKLPAPARVSGSGSGPAVVVIQNDSTHRLKLTISGPHPVLTTIGACTGCRTYTDADGPSSCPTAGPKKTFRIPAGTYSVGVEKDFAAGDNDDVTPFVGRGC